MLLTIAKIGMFLVSVFFTVYSIHIVLNYRRNPSETIYDSKSDILYALIFLGNLVQWVILFLLAI